MSEGVHMTGFAPDGLRRGVLSENTTSVHEAISPYL